MVLRYLLICSSRTCIATVTEVPPEELWKVFVEGTISCLIKHIKCIASLFGAMHVSEELFLKTVFCEMQVEYTDNCQTLE